MALPRALLLSFHDPLATSYGGGQRTHLLAKALSQFVQLDVAWLVEDGSTTAVTQLPALLGGGKLVQLAFKPRSVADAVWLGVRSRLLGGLLAAHVDVGQYDVLVCRYIHPLFKFKLPRTLPVLVDFDDPVYRIYFSGAINPRAVLKELAKWAHQFWVRWRLTHLGHPRVHYWFVSQRDADQFGFPKQSLLPNIPLQSTAAMARPWAGGDGKTLLFVGYLAWRPNMDAVNRFLKNVWPQVLAAVPQARFRIVGGASKEQIDLWSSAPGCVASGFVKDLAAAYHEAAVCIVPLHSGGGSNIKLVEACVHGCPVVASQYAFAGWAGYLQPGRDVLVANTDAQFAAHCIGLLQAPQQAAQMAAQGQRQVREQLSLDAFSEQVRLGLCSVQKSN